MPIVVATRDAVLLVDPGTGNVESAEADGFRPTCLAVDPSASGRTWCGSEDGVVRSDDGGRTWRRAGLDGEHVTAVAVGPARNGDGARSEHVVYAGMEPSAVWRSADQGGSWDRAEGLLDHRPYGRRTQDRLGPGELGRAQPGR